jgi:epoxyqueuosine reductase
MKKVIFRSTLSNQIKKYAKSLGVDLIGIASAKPDKESMLHLQNFIKENRHGNMTYLSRKVHPTNLLPGAKSIIVVAINYYRPVSKNQEGRIARYAYGRDYHKILKKILKQLAAFIQDQKPKAKTKICVDTSPLFEKSYAVQAGLGFIGKNTTLITKEFGSYVFLGEILTNLKLTYDKPAKGTCGTCTRCLDACPTKALIAPKKLDAKSCVSYLTIEHKGPIPKKFHKAMGNRIFGCDTCQEVCPYNIAYAKPATLKALSEPYIAGSNIPYKEVLKIKTDEEFLARFAGSPLMRAKRQGMQRNVKIAKKNHKC